MIAYSSPNSRILHSKKTRVSCRGFIFKRFKMPVKKTPSAKTVKKTVSPVPETVSQECCTSSSCRGSQIWLATLVIVLAQVLSIAYFSDLTVKKSLDGAKNFEYEKVGDKATFELLNKAQRLQLKAQLDQIKSFVEQSEKTAGSDKVTDGTPSPTTSNTGATSSDSKTMSKDEIAAIEKLAYLQGNEKARILAVEYTDPECPFCIRQAKDGILSKLLENFPDKVRVSHKVFRAVPHPGAEPKSLALLCAGKVGGTSAYNAYYNGIMERSTQEKVMPVDSILSLAKELQIDSAKFSACYDAKETMAEYDANTTEGQKYGVQGTPGTLIIDTESGKYELIAGAYPYESFQAAVEKFLK